MGEEARKQDMMKSTNTVVIKIGSSTLIDEKGFLDRDYIAALAGQVAAIRAAGWQPIIVSSGAIACGLKELGIISRPSDMPTLQAAASVGQSSLSRVYAEEFALHGMLTSMILLTRHDTASRHAYLHARDTLTRLLNLDVVPIVNENDTVSVEEIRFGDNDTLAALVSCLIKADLCVIFSDIEGLYTANPQTNPDASLCREVRLISDEIIASAGGTGSSVGSGGMETKIKAARVLMAAGIELVVCHGRRKNVLRDVVAHEEVGTRFVASACAHEITPRKLWIALGDTPRGALVVDSGAKQALIEKGSSLLPVGIVRVEGSFTAGDAVDIKDENNHMFARGLVAGSSDEVSLARGRTQAEVDGNRLLANLARRPIIHRDELIVFE